ncbi:MAG TPA: tetratricopeptide repeat protein [Thermoanaerobaculia bacterium]|nr:tetratricopeptide repeat protein [Thermoanaerobaculia bacterium]
MKHDKFVDEIGALSVRARANQRLLLAIAGAFVAIAAIVYGIFFYRSNRESNAQEVLAAAIDTNEATVSEQKPQNATGPWFKTEAERTAAAEKQFRDVQSQYSGTNAADVAGLYIARAAAAKGDTKTARALLEKFIDEHEDNVLVGAARFSLYQLRIESGEAGKVAQELTAEIEKSEPVLPGDSLLVLLAQAYDVQGDLTRSKEAYRRITTEFPESPYVVEAARRAS